MAVKVGMNPENPVLHGIELHLPETTEHKERLEKANFKWVDEVGLWTAPSGDKISMDEVRLLIGEKVAEIDPTLRVKRNFPDPIKAEKDVVHVVSTDPSTGETVEEVRDVSDVTEDNDVAPTQEIYISAEAEDTLEKAFLVARNQGWDDVPINIKLTGATGTGKTTVTKMMAEKAGMDVRIFSATTLRERSQWFGSFAPNKKTGQLQYEKSNFIKAIESPNTMVVLDELNRADPKVLNVLLPLLDDQRATYDPDSNTPIKVAKGVMFIATTNEGGGDDESYGGTEAFDRALIDRFISVDLDALPQEALADVLHKAKGVPEDRAEKISQLLDDLKNSAEIPIGHVSMRSAVNMARLIEMGLTPQQSAKATIPLPQGDEDERNQMAELLNIAVMNRFGDEGTDRLSELRKQGFGYLKLAGLQPEKSPTQSSLDKATR